jgi:predicted lipoprotein with Yx(FWY)xxD motif
MRPTRRAFLGTVAATAALSGCVDDGGGGGAETDTPTETPVATPTETPTASPTGTPTSTAMAPATVMVASHPELGDILVDGEGLTLYMFDNDTQGESSVCYDGCAQAWPPLLAEEPTAGEGVTAELSTFERETGEVQVAANGWPLYYYASDEAPGDANGQAVGDVWWVLTPDGTPMRSTATETASPTQSMY